MEYMIEFIQELYCLPLKSICLIFGSQRQGKYIDAQASRIISANERGTFRVFIGQPL